MEIESFKGHHSRGKSNDDVTNFECVGRKVKYFPKNLAKLFPNLKALVIRDCGLEQISREDLVGLEKLEWLDLSGNLLKSLPDDLFSNMKNLKRVLFNRNKIEFASSKLIEPIVGKRLERFMLSGNTSIDEYYLRGRKNGCETIQELMDKIDKKCKPQSTQQITKPSITQTIAKPLTPQPISNFVIVVGSKEFPVNKNVLAGQSAVLAKMFKIKKDGRFASKLEISDLSAEAVEAFLSYLYEPKRIDAQYAVEIFKLAAKYEVEKLKTICQKIIYGNLDGSNAFEIFKLTWGSQKSEKLKVAAFGKLQEKFNGKLDDDLMNDPEQLEEIVEAKKVLEDLMSKVSAKEQRHV